MPPLTADIGSDSEGRFDLEIKFRYLKGNREDDVVRGFDAGDLVLVIRHPHDQKNIELSPTLRLLGILLRRRVIEGTETVEELLDTSRPMQISIKEEFKDKPVFIGGVPRGRGLNPKRKPLEYSGLHDFFRRTCLR
jgi:hypothetical protein